MAEGSIDVFEQTECNMAIEHVSRKISQKFPQYPEFADKFKIHCMEEAFEETDVLIDDVAEGFDESVILEAIAEDIDIMDDDKEPLCQTIHNLLSNFVPPYPEPSSLDLREIYTNYNDMDINAMKKLVSSQVKLLEPNNKDISIYKVLTMGQKNNFPLLTYLVCSYQRYRLAEYFRCKTLEDEYMLHHKHVDKNFTKFEEVELNDFILNCNTMIDMNNSGDDEVLLWCSNAMKLCIHRNGIFYILPLIQSQITSKINDSLAIFQIYFIAFLLCVNNMIKESLIPFPSQIDIWMIPKNISLLEDDDDFLEDINKNFVLHEGLKYCDNLQQMDIFHEADLNIETLFSKFENVIKAVLNKQNHKRMCMVIDRRDNDKKHDKLYGYLPNNTQNISSRNNGQFLYESMVNLTKTEIFPSNNGEINENTIDANSDTHLNMFVMSLHIHRENEIEMYWHYKGSTNRFDVNDMITLWPSHFIVNEDEYNNSELVKQYILNNAFDELIDVNFQRFYEMNTGNAWIDTISPLFTAKPNTLQKRRDTNEQMEEKLQQYKKRQAAEQRHRQNLLNRQKSRRLKRAKSANCDNQIDDNWKKKSKFNEGDIKVDDEIVDVLDCDIEWKTNENKENEIEFIHNSNFDKNGLLYFLGTYAKRKKYVNPALIPLVSVNASSLGVDSKNIYMFVGRECVRCITNNTSQNPWMMVNIHPMFLKLKKYTLKHHNSHNAALLNWTLEASNGDNKWIILKNHSYDESLSNPASTKTWTVNTNHYFHQFRIVMTDKNNSGRWYLGCSGIELYGQAFGGLVSESLTEEFDEKLAQEVESEMKEEKKKDIDDLKSDHKKLKLDTKKIHKQAFSSSKTWNNLFKKSPKSSRNVYKNYVLKIKWNIYVKEYKKCLQHKGKIIRRLPDEFNQPIQDISYYSQFMFGSTVAINTHGFNQFKIKYESEKNEHCLDAVGITSEIQECKSKDRWITNTSDDEKVNGIRYVYCDGKIYYIHNYNDKKDINCTSFKWKNGQILTVQVDCIEEMCWYIAFFIDDEPIYQRIQMQCTETIKYYPVISTQCDDSKFTIVQ